MELSQLKQFRTVALTGNIVKAGEILYITQPALTRSIQKLESELGTELFDRKNHKLELNAAGKTVLAYTELILRDENQLLFDINHLSEEKMLRICSDIDSVLTYIVPDFLRENQNKSVIQKIEDLVYFESYLLRDKYDIAIAEKPMRHELIANEPFITEQLYVFVPESSPLIDKRKLSFDDLKNQTFLTTDKRNPVIVRKEEHLAQINPNVKFFLQPNQTAMYRVVKKKKFFMIVSVIEKKYMQESVAAGKYIPLTNNGDAETSYYLSYLKSEEKRLKEVVNYLKTKGQQIE